MTRNTLLARCSAAAAAATLIAGLAPPAMARPDPGGVDDAVELDSGGTKAQIEHDDQLYLDGRTKAQIEHQEQLSVPSTSGDNAGAHRTTSSRGRSRRWPQPGSSRWPPVVVVAPAPAKTALASA